MSLKDAEWYWGWQSRDESIGLLNNARDGTFFVRDSISIRGEYTLIVRKNGQDRSIKIHHRNGKFGLTEECNFESIEELINFHRTRSLVVYNPTLDVMLLFPLLRSLQNIELQGLLYNRDALVQRFITLTNEIKEKESGRGESLEKLIEQSEHIERDISFKRQAQDAFKELKKMIMAQIDLQLTLREQIEPHEMRKFDKNSDQLSTRMATAVRSEKKLVAELDVQRKRYQDNEMIINRVKADIKIKTDLLKVLKKLLLKQNIPENVICRIAEEGFAALAHHDSAEYKYSESYWLFESYTSDMARDALRDKKDGTFLVRPSRTEPTNYALSVVAGGVVHHCIIKKTERGNYGFAEPYNIYKSLKELVLHYSTNSLVEHNELLQTCLLHPINYLLQSTSTENLIDI